MTSSVLLPAWAQRREDGVILIDPDLAYPEFLKELGVAAPDRYWVEVAYQCAKLEVLRLVSHTDWDRRGDGVPLQFMILAHDGRKDRWALANLPAGRGEDAATKGLEAREHYRRLRGFIPQ